MAQTDYFDNKCKEDEAVKKMMEEMYNTISDNNEEYMFLFHPRFVKEIEEGKVESINENFQTGNGMFVKDVFELLNFTYIQELKKAKIALDKNINHRDITAFMENIIENNNAKVQLAFWLLYNFSKLEVEKRDAVLRRICIYLIIAHIDNDILKEILETVKYLNNETLDEIEYKTEEGKKNFSGLMLKGNGKSKAINCKDGENNQIKKEIEIFSNYMKAGYPIILVNTFEEQEAIKVISSAAKNLNGDTKIYIWDEVEKLYNKQTGIKRLDAGFEEVLNDICETVGCNSYNNVYIFRTIKPYLKDDKALGKLKILSENIKNQNVGKTFIFILDKDIDVDSSYEKYFYLDNSIGYPDANTIKYIIKNFFNEKNVKINRTVSTEKGNESRFDEMISKCKGLTQDEIYRVLSLAYVKSKTENDCNEYAFDTDSMLDLIQKEKKQIIKKVSLVEIIDIDDDMVEVQGLENLIGWIKVKEKIINNSIKASENRVDSPRGVLLIGMPGCGKSLCAKYVAKLFKVPLLKIDMGRLMNKYLGESEHNFRDALKLAEAISPCVLWVDEIEKAFGKSNEENYQSETASRILGYLLTWMQEKKTLTFVVATANDVKKLPPEMLRKGRFDETFFVDLPNEKERASILEAHLAKRGISYDDYAQIAKKTKDYSGAEIEYVVRDVTEKRFINILDGKTGYVNEKMFLEAIENTVPLSQTMKDELNEMRKFCQERKFRKASVES